MGELHVQMNITLDGVIQANGGPSEQDAGFGYAGWEAPYGDDESGAQVVADIQRSDALLLGRTTYDIWRGYWPFQQDPIGDVFNNQPKYVASRGTPELSWEGSTQVRDAAAEVGAIRERHRETHVWGSADLCQTLFREGLVDLVNLWVCPVVVGEGKKLWPAGTMPSRYELAEPPRAFPGGSILLRYRHVDGPPETGISGAR
jgi:dihydrofolate reductase